MSRNGSGVYSLPIPPNPFVTGTTISAPDMNTTLSDIATALTGSIARDGQSPLTANWPVGGYNITGIGTLGCTTLSVSGAVTFSGALTIGGALTVSAGGAAITGNSSVTGTFSASGATTFGSTLGVTGAITGASIISGSTTLPVTFPWSTNACWEQNGTVVDGDFTFSAYMPFAGTLSGLKYKTASGTFTVAVKINGSTVTGLSAVAVSSSSYNTAAASAANTFVAGDVVTGTISSAAGSPTGSVLTIYGTRAL